MNVEQVPLDTLYLQDERFRISRFFALDRLILSLKEIGLVHPPLVIWRDNLLILVTGWKRILACLELSLSPIPVVCLEEQDDLKVFLKAFHENLTIREYSLLEKAEILKKLKHFGEKEKSIVRHYLPRLGIPSTAYHLDTYLAFSEFHPDIQKTIHEKQMSFAVLELLASFSPQDRKRLLPLLLPLGLNKQRELLEDCREISIREDLSAVEILMSSDIRKILTSKKLSDLQKSNEIRHLLRKKRYPHLSSQQERFVTTLKNVDWQRDVNLEPSRFFEEDKMTLRFNFKNEEELKDTLSKLQEVSSKKEFVKIFKPPTDD